MLEVNELIAANAARHPERKALVTPRGGFTYEELCDAVERQAALLVARGIGSGSKVGIMLHNGAPFAVHLLAFLRLGCEVTLFNFRYRGAELARSISLTKPCYIVASEGLRPVVRQALGLVPSDAGYAPVVASDDVFDAGSHRDAGSGPSDRTSASAGAFDAHPGRGGSVTCNVARDGFAPRPSSAAVRDAWRDGSAPCVGGASFAAYDVERGGGLAWDALDVSHGAAQRHAPALNIFTGGTTGVPKAVVHTYGGLSYQLISYLVRTPQARRAPYDVTLSSAPLFHIGGLDILLGTLVRGGTLVLPAGFDVDAMTEMALAENVTSVVLIPPTLIEGFSRIGNVRREDLARIEHVIVSGGACSPEIARKIFAVLPRVRVTGVYGMSEHVAALWTSFDKQEFDADPSVAAATGATNFMYDVKLIGDDGAEAAPGEVGELYGRSPCMLRRYYGDEAPFTEDGYLPTGDLFSRDERGVYWFHARSKDVIKSGGENVFAVEVEDALLAHPAVAECAVVGVPDDFYGEAVAAAVVLRGGCDASADELVAFCKERIASYKKPRRVLFVDELPKTSIGKVLKTEVRTLFEQG